MNQYRYQPTSGFDVRCGMRRHTSCNADKAGADLHVCPSSLISAIIIRYSKVQHFKSFLLPVTEWACVSVNLSESPTTYFISTILILYASSETVGNRHFFLYGCYYSSSKPGLEPIVYYSWLTDNWNVRIHSQGS